jgi:hypothetical protein
MIDPLESFPSAAIEVTNEVVNHDHDRLFSVSRRFRYWSNSVEITSFPKPSMGPSASIGASKFEYLGAIPGSRADMYVSWGGYKKGSRQTLIQWQAKKCGETSISVNGGFDILGKGGNGGYSKSKNGCTYVYGTIGWMFYADWTDGPLNFKTRLALPL